MGARGLHQRLRHRATWRRRWPSRASGADASGATGRSPSTSSTARTDYVNMFDPAVGFFQGRDASGRWKSSPDDYDPRVWGHEHDYTETDGWNFAFHAPQDGQGLANLYGGRDALAAQARRVLRHARRPATFPGSYGGTIHEMLEARDVRMGQWGFSQPGLAPHPVHVRLRRAAVEDRRRRSARRCAACTSAPRSAQGYAGDEDNGEMSAWYLFSALGLLPAADGQPELRDRLAAVQEGDDPPGRTGEDIVVSAPNNSARNVYVQGLRVNGRRCDKTYLPPLEHRQRRHARRSTWARGRRAGGPARDAAPPSITAGRRGRRSRCATPPAHGRGDASTGNDARRCSTTLGHRGVDRPTWVEYAFDRRPRRVTLLHADLGRRRRAPTPRAGR